MLGELKWLIPVCAAVIVSILTLMRSQSDAIPSSRAFVIAASLLMATIPIIASGKIGKDGIEIVTLGQVAQASTDALQKLDERLTRTETALSSVQKLVTEVKSTLPPTTPEASKIRLDGQLKTLQEAIDLNQTTRLQFNDIKKSLDSGIKALRAPPS